MKKSFYYHSLLLLIITLLASCNKEGPMGPEGPEGPAGNPGANSNGGGGTGATVKVYTSDPEMDDFQWKGSQYYFSLQRRKLGLGSWDSRFTIPDEDEVIPDALVLVYLKMKKGTSAPPWYNLPYVVGTASTVIESFTPSTWYDVVEHQLYVSAFAEVRTPNPNDDSGPSYNVKGIRIVVIPAGEVNTTGRAAMPDKNLTFEEVMEKYKVQEKDFKPLQ